MTLRARMYDARGEDRDVELTTEKIGRIDDRRLLWIDLDERADKDLEILAKSLELQPRLTEQLGTVTRRSKLIRFPDRILITLGALERKGEDVGRRELDVLVGRNLVVTVHDGQLTAIDEFEEQLKDESGLGGLDAGAFMTALVDAVTRHTSRRSTESSATSRSSIRRPSNSAAAAVSFRQWSPCASASRSFVGPSRRIATP